MKTWLKRSALVLVVILIVIQTFRPSRKNPPIDPTREIAAVMTVDPIVAGIFGRSCNDCHSNRTVWPAYSQVAPVSWLVEYDVRAGRKELNLSEWGSYSTARKSKKLKEMCKEVTEGEMPGSMYTLMHPQAKLSGADVQAICRWAQSAP